MHQQAKYEKIFKNEMEEKSHMEIFLKNKQKIEEHNKLYSQGLVSYSMRLNELSDLPSDEIRKQMKSFRNPDLLT